MGNSTIFVDGARKVCCVSCCLESVSPENRFKKQLGQVGSFFKVQGSSLQNCLSKVCRRIFHFGETPHISKAKSLVSFGQCFVFTSFRYNKILCFVEKEGANTLTGIF